MTAQTPTEIRVNPTKFSDQEAFIDAGRKGTGAFLRTRTRGQRGGVRTEQYGLTNAARVALIVALGGTPQED